MADVNVTTKKKKKKKESCKSDLFASLLAADQHDVSVVCQTQTSLGAF